MILKIKSILIDCKGGGDINTLIYTGFEKLIKNVEIFILNHPF